MIKFLESQRVGNQNHKFNTPFFYQYGCQWDDDSEDPIFELFIRHIYNPMDSQVQEVKFIGKFTYLAIAQILAQAHSDCMSNSGARLRWSGVPPWDVNYDLETQCMNVVQSFGRRTSI